MDQIKEKYNHLSQDAKRQFLNRLKSEGEKYGIYPLSRLQQSMLFLYIADPLDTAYQIRFLINFSKTLNSEMLTLALKETLNRHNALRMRLLMVDGEYFQSVLKIEKIDLHVESVTVREDMMHRIEREYTRRMNLESEIPIQLRLFFIADENCYALSVCMHHLFSDGWSVEVFYKELLSAYRNLLITKDRYKITAKAQYTDYVRMEKTIDQEDNRRFWIDYLNGSTFQTYFPRESVDQQAVNKQKETIFVLLDDKQIMDKLAKTCESSVFSFGLGIYEISLWLWCLQEDFNIGIPVLNREDYSFTDSIGYFVNTLPVRCRPDDGDTIIEFLRKTQESVLKVIEHASLPFPDIVEMLVTKGTTEGNPIFQTVYMMNEIKRTVDSIEDAAVWLENIDNSDTLQFDFVCSMVKTKKQYMLRIDYRKQLFKKERINEFIQIYQKIYHEILLNEDKTIQEIVHTIKGKKAAEKNLCEQNIFHMEMTQADGTSDSELLNVISKVWEEVLGNCDYGIEDSFFDIGGNSILCIKLFLRLKTEVDETIKITDLFRYNTIKSMSTHFSQSRN